MSDDAQGPPRLGRRLLVLRVSAAALALAPVAAEAQQKYAPRRSGITDSDPSDGEGNGRGGYRPRSGATDSDPSDGPGRGRGGYRAAPRRVTDSDPSDGAGSGRGYRAAPRRVTDSDPSDGAGRGRGYR